jgi:hypothetical protein
LITILVTTPIAILNVEMGAVTFSYLLWLTAAVSIIGVILNHRGHYVLAASMVSIMVFVSIFYTIIDGDGFSDPGVVVIPIFVIFSAFLFGPLGIIAAGGASVSAIVLIYYLYHSGVLDLANDPSLSVTIIILIVIIGSAAISWVIFRSWSNSLDSLRESYDKTLESWAKLVEYRDPDTLGHSRRVVEMCTILAQELELPPADIASMREGRFFMISGKWPYQIRFSSTQAIWMMRSGRSCGNILSLPMTFSRRSNSCSPLYQFPIGITNVGMGVDILPD